MNYIKHLHSQDETKIYAKIQYVDEPKGNVIISHGLTEHLDRYDHVANFLIQHNFNVIRYDQRGHGHSGGKPIYFDRADEIIEDLDAVVNYVQHNFGYKTYLLGHSMGGCAVTLYGTKNPNKIDGYITSGAATRMSNNIFKDLISQGLSVDYYIDNPLNGEGSTCSDPRVVKNYEYDDTVGNPISMGLIYRFYECVEYLKNNYASFIDPVLIMHGRNDNIVSVEDSLQFYNEIASENKSLRIYNGLEHEILNESSYNKVIMQDLLNWIENQ